MRTTSILLGFGAPLAAALLTLAACSDGDGAGPGDADGGGVKALASGVLVDHVAIYQGVKVTLLDQGSPKKPNAPVIPSRPGLLRVHVASGLTALAPKDQFRATAELHIAAPGRPEAVVSDGPRTLMAFADGDLASTFNFDLLEDHLQPGATFYVVLRDPSGADPTTFRYPAEGEPPFALPVETFAPTLKVKFVPVKYQADGSDRLPTLDPASVEAYRRTLYKLYPVSKVELTVREQIVWPLAVAADGDGWDEILSAVIETRSDDKVGADQYYVGVFNPAETEREYCRQGCILGVAPGGIFKNLGVRSAMVVGYKSERSHGTLAQELAHSMGRLHAPCGNPADIDLAYPYKGGGFGVWGYDVLERKLRDPERDGYDFMSYCNPVWVSDYTFAALYKQMLEVDHAAVLEGDDGLGGTPAARRGAPAASKLLVTRSPAP